MKPEHLIYLAAESIPFGPIEAARPLARGPRVRDLIPDSLGARIAAAALMFGALAGLVWVALAYAAAL